jgi:hypothetical protein
MKPMVPDQLKEQFKINWSVEYVVSSKDDVISAKKITKRKQNQ